MLLLGPLYEKNPCRAIVIKKKKKKESGGIYHWEGKRKHRFWMLGEVGRAWGDPLGGSTADEMRGHATMGWHHPATHHLLPSSRLGCCVLHWYQPRPGTGQGPETILMRLIPHPPLIL